MNDATTSGPFDLPGMIPVASFTLGLLAIFLVASWFAAWYDERTRRATAAIREGALLPSGFGSFFGVARALDDRAAGELVKLTRSQVIKQGVEGPRWADYDRTVTGGNFALVHEGGEEIEVDAHDAVIEGFPETSSGAYQGGGSAMPQRELHAAVNVGDAVWVTGVLARPKDNRGGAYRSGISRRKLRAPKRGRVMLSAMSPAIGWRARARSHKIGGYSALAALVALHAAFFRGFDVALVKSRLNDGMGIATYKFHPMLIVPAAIAVVVVAIIYGRELTRGRDHI